MLEVLFFYTHSVLFMPINSAFVSIQQPLLPAKTKYKRYKMITAEFFIIQFCSSLIYNNCNLYITVIFTRVRFQYSSWKKFIFRIKSHVLLFLWFIKYQKERKSSYPLKRAFVVTLNQNHQINILFSIIKTLHKIIWTIYAFPEFLSQSKVFWHK